MTLARFVSGGQNPLISCAAGSSGSLPGNRSYPPALFASSLGGQESDWLHIGDEDCVGNDVGLSNGTLADHGFVGRSASGAGC